MGALGRADGLARKGDRVKSDRSNPTVQATEGDERIRTAELALGTDPVYELLPGPGYDPRVTCPKCGASVMLFAASAHMVGHSYESARAEQPRA